MENKVFETVSFHIVKPCNMGCKFCYATFDDMHVPILKAYDALEIIAKLAKAGIQKITFAGGEPMMYPHLVDCLVYAKSLGMTTSIITNGSFLTDGFLQRMVNTLDWIGISVDSLNDETNHKIGRTTTKNTMGYYTMVDLIKSYGYKLKINTVVNIHNHKEDLNSFINYSRPDRWKVFQALRVEGQNDNQFDAIKVSKREYSNFIARHTTQYCMVPEDNKAMTGSYLLVDPQGRLFENSAGIHTYSDSLVTNSFEHCINQINLDREMFIKRGGIYNW